MKEQLYLLDKKCPQTMKSLIKKIINPLELIQTINFIKMNRTVLNFKGFRVILYSKIILMICFIMDILKM